MVSEWAGSTGEAYSLRWFGHQADWAGTLTLANLIFILEHIWLGWDEREPLAGLTVEPL